MSPEAQRIAIAEACGFRRQQFKGSRSSFLEHPSAPYPWYDGPREEPTMSLAAEPGEEFQKMVPDYLNDLSAMHVAEQYLGTPGKAAGYCERLNEVICAKPSTVNCYAAGWDYHATAAQRAEAFLRTLGLWKEGA